MGRYHRETRPNLRDREISPELIGPVVHRTYPRGYPPATNHEETREAIEGAGDVRERQAGAGVGESGECAGNGENVF